MTAYQREPAARGARASGPGLGRSPPPNQLYERGVIDSPWRPLAFAAPECLSEGLRAPVTAREPQAHKALYALQRIKGFWRLHLTGVPPWAVCGRAIEARRVPACPRRRGRYCTGSLGSDEVLVAHRLVSDGELEHSVEHHPAAAGASAVEAEHELVQVAGQMDTVH